jgi:hypothetical protein
MRGTMLAALVCAAVAVPVATADPTGWSVTGSGVGSGALTGDHVEIAAFSDVGGANPRGHGEQQGALPSEEINDGGPVACLRVHGNQAVVVWRLRTTVTDPALPGFVGEFGAVFVEDNGNPVGGQPVDRMADFVLRASTAQLFCDTDLGFAFAGAAAPLQTGNLIVRG